MKLAVTLIFFFVFGSVVASITGTFDDGRANKDNDDSISFHAHVELGDVHWHRKFEKAKNIARTAQRPMFVLFQEIPGCQTCQDFGNQPLSHPLIVEAVEDLFVPVTIFNNKPGYDEKWLKHFKERAWNNPVVRFMTADEQDLIARKDGVWSTEGIAQRMIESLQQAEKEVPDYLTMISMPANTKIETAEFAMHCYWEGEVLLGGIEGVFTTRSGWRGNLEVVQLQYSPQVVSFEQLLDSAMNLNCASKVFAHTPEQLTIAKQKVGNKVELASGKVKDAKASDQKYYLTKTPYRHLPLTAIQATKINALAKTRRSPAPILSPRQKALLKQISEFKKSNPNGLNQLQFPNDQSQLGDYQAKLVQAIKSSQP